MSCPSHHVFCHFANVHCRSCSCHAVLPDNTSSTNVISLTLSFRDLEPFKFLLHNFPGLTHVATEQLVTGFLKPVVPSNWTRQDRGDGRSRRRSVAHFDVGGGFSTMVPVRPRQWIGTSGLLRRCLWSMEAATIATGDGAVSDICSI